jgi:hypothetical protein
VTQLDIAFLERFTDTIGPIGKSLGMLIRPTFIAAPGKTLVWGDWSAIEARVLPWLAASPGAEQQLAIFRASDADKTRPDVYVFNAAQLLGVDPQVMWDAFLEGEKWAKDGRQSHGKVPVLSLGFGGAVGALMKMAINYKVYLDEATAQKMVEGWRAANQWAPDFWGKFHVDRHGNVERSSGLWGAVNMALRNPGTAYAAGRVAYVFDESYMGGTLFCALPCGRLLTYPDCRLRTRKVKDKDTGEESEKTAIWYRKGYGWSALWHGKCAENITQAVAGSILRETLKQLDLDFTQFDIVRELWAVAGEDGAVGSTHDEVLLEVDDRPDVVALAREVLDELMGRWRPEWRADLPLTAEVVENTWYTKSLG